MSTPAADPMPRRMLLWMLRQREDRIRVLEHEVNHWYLRAHHTPEELREMYERASKGLDDHGRWLWPDGEMRPPA